MAYDEKLEGGADLDASGRQLPNARGYIERMEEDDLKILTVDGWMLSFAGPFQSVFVEMDGRTFPASRIYRPGIGRAFPRIPNAADAGFTFSVPLDQTRFSSGEFQEFALVGCNDGKPIAQMRGGYYRSPVPWSPPPEHLMMRVANTKHSHNFYASGMKTCINMLSYARRHLSIGDVHSVLDWGCGCGRLTPHLLRCLPGAKIYGTDIDPEAIEWTASKFPDAHVDLCRPFPPLPYGDSSFDLILAGSVFTHLTQSDQLSWLREMRRLLTDRGLLIATTHGEFSARFSWPENFEERLGNGICDQQRDKICDGIAPPDYYRATFQTKEYTTRAWGQVLDIIDYIEAGYANFQDLFVLRKGSALDRN